MLVSVTSSMRSLKGQPAFLAFMLATGLIVAFCFEFNPRFETNDDVGMSMIAHGYGLAAYGSPLLINSNVLWGNIVRAIPSINGVLGYSVATLTVLLVIGWTMLYFLLRLGVGHFASLLTVALIVTRPTLFPQFTMNAGLLTVAAIIGWQVYSRHGGVGNLVVACLLAFFGYLVRDKEFLLVLGVALPLLPWRMLRDQRQMQIAFLLLGVAIALAATFDHLSYSGPEWQHFNDESSPLTNIIDYGAGKHLEQHPEILTRHGYSQNDIRLISGWFFVDPQIVDPNSLNAMLAELGTAPMRNGSIQSGFTALKALADPVLLPLILSALLLLVLTPERSLVLTWILCVAALFTIGIMGRPGQLRVYVPLISLLLVAPFVVRKWKEGTRQWIAVLTLFVGCVGNAYVLKPQVLESMRGIQQVQRDIQGLPAVPIVIWSDIFPYQMAFPVLGNDLTSRDIILYGLNGLTNAPFSIARTEEMAGRGVLKRLRTAEGILIVASPKKIEQLHIYCKERMNGNLRKLITRAPLLQVRCENSSGYLQLPSYSRAAKQGDINRLETRDATQKRHL